MCLEQSFWLQQDGAEAEAGSQQAKCPSKPKQGRRHDSKVKEGALTRTRTHKVKTHWAPEIKGKGPEPSSSHQGHEVDMKHIPE